MYTNDQIYFCLNALSNISGEYNQNPDVVQLTQTAVNTVLQDKTGVIQGLIGNWVPVWGPVVNVFNGDAANTMFVAQNTTTKEYVVSIAGTNPSSFFDWLLEDALVGKKVYWNLLDHSCGCVSAGTDFGLTALKLMKYNGQSVFNYLQSVNAKNITVTGHSLGGALSPVMALFLSNNLKGANVSCRPTAGATPGDSDFATYWNGSVVGKNANTVRVWNAIDVVPNAYEWDTMQNIPDLYLPNITCPTSTASGIVTESNKLQPLDYTQLLKTTTTTFDLDVYNQGNPADPFMDQALYQHVAAYAVHFNIPAFQNQVQNLLSLSAPYFSAGTTVKQATATEALA